ncbi:MAG: peptide ABC transporter permease [Coxiellaceae bacterium]|nr:peptide ABC transporter permease [Coxiellaceae bacterium]|tara:strand:+ start:464 stop:1444 length:981 start_codon:yes stop_codon:yes gene_type:complete
MWVYIIRRVLYAIPIIIGVNIITFALFFMVNTPDDMARMHLGDKHVSQASVERWKAEQGYNLPLFYNPQAPTVAKITQTLFFQKTIQLLSFQFGSSNQGRDIGHDIGQRMWPSLALAVPTLLVGLIVNISLALLIVLFRGTYLDTLGVIGCVILMSISGLFYIIIGQFILGKWLQLVPISGYQGGLQAWRFLVLPVLIGVISGIGMGVRWYRTIFLEEMQKDYVRTARAKGLSEIRVLFSHVLKNGMLPILTGVVVIIPSLFLGSLIMESFFGIPGLGSYTIDAIQQQDFSVVRAMVFIGTLLYILGLILTDISYAMVDPRVRLGK